MRSMILLFIFAIFLNVALSLNKSSVFSTKKEDRPYSLFSEVSKTSSINIEQAIRDTEKLAIVQIERESQTNPITRN